MLRLKIDENLPTAAADLIAQAGHDVTTVYTQGLNGESDRQILHVCQQEGRAFVTLDLDFADIRAYPPSGYAGLVVLRLAWQDRQHVLAAVQRWLSHLEERNLPGKLWIVGEASIRVRA